MNNSEPAERKEIPNKQSYHLREVAHIFDCSVRTIQRLAINGEIKIHKDKFGSKRISHEELEDFKLRNKSMPCGDPFPRAKNTPDKTAAWLLDSMGEVGMAFDGADFLRMRKPIVYAWIRDGVVLYIGMSRRGLARAIGTHHVLAIFEETDTLLVWQYTTEDEAVAKEREMIVTVKPVYNNVHI